jgi:hypothetical protein
MICAGCRHVMEIGDQYIEGVASDYVHQDVAPEIASLLADILGGNAALDGSTGGKIVYCEDCTVDGGDFRLSTYYGDEKPRSSTDRSI